jgi:hypothetical protein
MGPAGLYWMFGRAGRERAFGGMYGKPPEVPAPGWLSYVRVPSADRAAAAVTRLGGRVVTGPMEVPGGDRIAMCVDPQGIAFAVHSLAVPVAARKPAKPKATKGKRKPRAAAKTKRKPARPKKVVRRKRR